VASKPLINLTMSDDTDTDIVIPVRMRDILQWEKSFPARSLASLNEDRVKLTYLYELCFVIARNKSLVDCTFIEFTERYDVAEQHNAGQSEDVVPVDPTPVAAPTGPSLNLPLSPESVSVNGDASLSVTNA
jgi:hypothetical protein